MDWAGLMQELISKLLKALPRAKGTSLSSYLAHLYRHAEVLVMEEGKHYVEQEKIWSYGETDSETGSEESNPKLSPPEPSPLPPSPVGPSRSGARKKTTPRT